MDLPQASHMDTTEFMENLVQISRPILSPIKRVINSIPNSSPSHIHPQDFKNQIEEIDLALKKFDSPTPSTINMPTVSLTHSNPGGNKSGIIIDILGDEHKVIPLT